MAVCVWFMHWDWVGLEPPFTPILGMTITSGFVLLALLMVSSVPYPSLKVIKLEGKRAYPTLVAIVVFAVAILLHHEPMMFGLGVIFLLSGPVYWLILRRRERAGVTEEVPRESGGDVG